MELDNIREEISNEIFRMMPLMRELNRYFSGRGPGGTASGLTENEHLVLALLFRNNGSLSLREIRDRTNIHPSVLSGVLKGLEKTKKYIARSIDESDTRAFNITLTEKGKEVIEQSHKAMKEKYKAILCSFTRKSDLDIIFTSARLFNEAINSLLKEIQNKNFKEFGGAK